MNLFEPWSLLSTQIVDATKLVTRRTNTIRRSSCKGSGAKGTFLYSSEQRFIKIFFDHHNIILKKNDQ